MSSFLKAVSTCFSWIGKTLFFTGKCVSSSSKGAYKLSSWGINQYKDYSNNQKKSEEILYEKVFAAYQKIKKGDMSGRKDLAILKSWYGEKRVNLVLKEIQYWESLERKRKKLYGTSTKSNRYSKETNPDSEGTNRKLSEHRRYLDDGKSSGRSGGKTGEI